MMAAPLRVLMAEDEQLAAEVLEVRGDERMVDVHTLLETGSPATGPTADTNPTSSS